MHDRDAVAAPERCETLATDDALKTLPEGSGAQTGGGIRRHGRGRRGGGGGGT